MTIVILIIIGLVGLILAASGGYGAYINEQEIKRLKKTELLKERMHYIESAMARCVIAIFIGLVLTAISLIGLLS